MTLCRAVIAAGLRLLFGDPYLRPVTVYAAVVNVPISGIDALLVVFLVRTIGVSAGAVGGAMALMGVGGVIGALCAGRLERKLGNSRAILLCLAVLVPFGLLLPLTGHGAGLAFLVGYAITHVGLSAGQIIFGGFRQRYCPPGMIGRITSASFATGYLGVPLGALAAGAIASAASVRTALWILSGWMAVAGFVLMLSPAFRRRELPGGIMAVGDDGRSVVGGSESAEEPQDARG